MFKIIFHYSNLNGILLLVLSAVMIMSRMTLPRDTAVFVVTQKIHHFTPGWYHIHVGRHVGRPCNHAVGTAVCCCVIQVSAVNLNCPHGSPRNKIACCNCKCKTLPLPAMILQNLWQYRYAFKCYKVQYSAMLFCFYQLDVCCFKFSCKNTPPTSDNKKKLSEVIKYLHYFSKVGELRLTVIIVLLVTFLHIQAGK